MSNDVYHHSCVGTGFIVLDVIHNSIGPSLTVKRYAGGSCGNVLTILAYFGWKANAVGRIGDDYVGHALVEDLSKWHVNTNFLQMEAGRGTPIVIQEIYHDTLGRPRHRFSRTCPVCGATLPAYRPLLISEATLIGTRLPKHSVFYFDRVAPGTLELAQKSRASGALVVFEPSGIKNERLFTECLKAAHIVKYANDRIEGVHEIVAKIRVPVEIETLGAKGLRLRIRTKGRVGTWKEFPAFSAPELRDAAGAGDWTTAGLIHGIMGRGASADEAVEDVETVVLATRRGQALAALNCCFEGARGLMYVVDSQRVRELAAAIAKGSKKLSSLEYQLSKGENMNSTGNICLTCSGAKAVHM